MLNYHNIHIKVALNKHPTQSGFLQGFKEVRKIYMCIVSVYTNNQSQHTQRVGASEKRSSIHSCHSLHLVKDYNAEQHQWDIWINFPHHTVASYCQASTT